MLPILVDFLPVRKPYSFSLTFIWIENVRASFKFIISFLSVVR